MDELEDVRIAEVPVIGDVGLEVWRTSSQNIIFRCLSLGCRQAAVCCQCPGAGQGGQVELTFDYLLVAVTHVRNRKYQEMAACCLERTLQRRK